MPENAEMVMHVTSLRSSKPYHDAVSRVHRARSTAGAVAAMASGKKSSDYSDVRLVIGTWERIALLLRESDQEQRRRLFHCVPVFLMWKLLEPAVEKIRESGADDTDGTPSPSFAREFEDLAEEYRRWTQTDEGAEFRSPAGQAVCALFG